MDDQVLHELSVVADYLMTKDPEATFADLFKAYFQYKTGSNYEEVLGPPPDDEQIIEMHLEGLTPKTIADFLGDYEDYVKWLLLNLGFSPFTYRGLGNVEKTKAKLLVEQAKYKEYQDGI